jgi:hypothetical protein
MTLSRNKKTILLVAFIFYIFVSIQMFYQDKKWNTILEELEITENCYTLLDNKNLISVNNEDNVLIDKSMKLLLSGKRQMIKKGSGHFSTPLVTFQVESNKGTKIEVYIAKIEDISSFDILLSDSKSSKNNATSFQTSIDKTNYCIIDSTLSEIRKKYLFQ